MGRQFREIRQAHRDFISEQKVFFVATAMEEGRINLSPKGIDSFRVVDEKRVVWLNLTGSGNETAAHVRHSGRMTLMFCSFEGPPTILRLYGKAVAYQKGDNGYMERIGLFPEIPGSRQLFEVEVDLVQTSCGMGVPLMDFRGHRKELIQWARDKGEEGLKDYMQKKNKTSLDGHPTGLL